MPIIDLIKKGESRKVEFKEIFPESSKIIKTVIAFSNGAGGKLIIGVKDRTGEIVGISDEDVIELPDRISNIIYDSCYPTIIPEIYVENIEDKNVLVIEVFTGNLKPYYIKKKGKLKGTYIRVGATNKLVDEEMIMELERQKRNISFDEEILYDYDFKNIDLQKLKADFQRLIETKITDKDLLNLKLIKEENEQIHPTKALVLLADKNNYFEYSRIKCARFKGKDIGEFIDQKEFNGPLYEQIEAAMKFAKNHISKRGKIEGLQRRDEYEVPIVAIREALINAVVHRDYNISGSDIKFAIFDDRIEITSPGFLPKTLDIEDIRAGRSEIRNKILARFFKEIRFIEQWGTGIRRIIKSCYDAGLKEPEFNETGMFFKVTIYKDSSVKVPDSSVKVPDGSRKTYHEENGLSDNERIVVNYIRENNKINTKTAAELIGISTRGTRKIFEKLKEKGIIEPVGKGRSRYYILKKWYVYWVDFK